MVISTLTTSDSRQGLPEPDQRGEALEGEGIDAGDAAEASLVGCGEAHLRSASSATPRRG